MPEYSLPYTLPRFGSAEQLARGRSFLQLMQSRRSCRHFSPEPVPQELLDLALQAALSAPSGANKQPWTFCVVQDPHLRERIRLAAEKEEHTNYIGGRMPPEWRADIEPLGTTWQKEYLSTAPVLIAVFAQSYAFGAQGQTLRHYYVQESVGIAVGILLAALHNVGLATLLHTPSPMNFLSDILARPKNERPYLLIPVGYPAPEAVVPPLPRKSLSEAVIRY